MAEDESRYPHTQVKLVGCDAVPKHRHSEPRCLCGKILTERNPCPVPAGRRCERLGGV
jgi:hypothetical protein